MVDVAIAGGGLAGSALAMLLGRSGFSVELFDRDVFPREKPCGEGLMPAGIAVLGRLGLENIIGGAPFEGVRYHFGNRHVKARFPKGNGRDVYGLGLRRRHLDGLLFQTAAETHGVRAYTSARVEGPICEQGRIAGLVVDGEARRARLTVGADGAHSRIRRCLEWHPGKSRKRMGIRVHYRLAPGRRQPRWVDVLLRSGYEFYVTPLPDGEVLIAALADVEWRSEPIHRTFQRWILVEPLLAKLLEGADRISEPMCATWCTRDSFAPNVPGLVLLGDAAGTMDPISGGGMTHALLTAELLAEHMRNRFKDGVEWVSSFERERRNLLTDFRRLTGLLLWLAEHPSVAAGLLSAAEKSPAALSYFAGVAGGTRHLGGKQDQRRARLPSFRPGFRGPLEAHRIESEFGDSGD